MAASRGAGRRTCWTTRVWRILCLLTVMSGLLAVTGVLWSLPPIWGGVALTPGLLVMLLFAIASYADWSGSRDASRRR